MVNECMGWNVVISKRARIVSDVEHYMYLFEKRRAFRGAS
jgi:hypothetical protein